MKKVFQRVDNNKLKREFVESIQKNIACIDFLEEMEKRYEDIYKYSQSREDEISLEKVKWIKFQIEWNVGLFEKSLKKIGGKPSAIQPFEWE